MRFNDVTSKTFGQIITCYRIPKRKNHRIKNARDESCFSFLFLIAPKLVLHKVNYKTADKDRDCFLMRKS